MVSASRAADPRFDSRLRRGGREGGGGGGVEGRVIPVATLPGARRYRVNAGTGWPGVSLL